MVVLMAKRSQQRAGEDTAWAKGAEKYGGCFWLAAFMADLATDWLWGSCYV